MNGIVTSLGLTRRTLPLLLLLLVAAPLANLLHVPLLFDVYLIFGSVAAMVAVQLLATPTAVLIAASAGLVTVFLWGHPYALLIFSLEALVVGLLHRRRGHNLIVADTLFWLFCGMPLIAVCYYLGLNNDVSTTVLIMLKQPLNGVLNALLASLLVVGLASLSQQVATMKSGRFGFAEVLFIALLLGISVAGTLPIAMEGVRDQKLHERFMTQQLREQANFLAHRLERDSGQVAPPLNDYLELAQTQPDMGITVLDQNGRPVARQGHLASLNRVSGELVKRSPHLQLWLPLDQNHALKRWQTGAYRTVKPLQDVPGLDTIIVELPAAPLVEQLRVDQLWLLAWLFAIVMLGILAAGLLSIWLTRPLSRLTRTSHNLTQQIISNKAPRLPGSLLWEYNDLAITLTNVSQALADAFGELHRNRDSLAQQVEEKTTEIINANILLNRVLDAAIEVSIIATDTDGTITIFSKGAERMLGYRAGEMVGQFTPTRIHKPEEVEARSRQLSAEFGKPVTGFQTFVAKAEHGESDIRDWTYIHKDGHGIPVSLIVNAITDNRDRITGYVGIAIDISERQRMDKLKDEFISTVSHELRTPLTSISGSLSLVLSGTMGELDPKMEQMLTIASKNSQRLIHLVNDLLDIQRIASGKMVFNLQPHPLPELIRDAIEQNQPYGREHHIELVTRGELAEVTVTVDRERLLQALANLLSNAIKFSPDHETVVVTTELRDQGVRVSVADRGVGIPRHFHKHIFKRFAQADGSDSRNKGGTGLGLAITRELIEHMGGQVGFESRENRGSVFHLLLPFQEQGQPAPPTTAATVAQRPLPATAPRHPTTNTKPFAAEKPRVLHVEDDPDLRKVVRVAVQDSFKIDCAGSLAQARERLGDVSYDLVVLDIGLPDGSGWQLVPDIYRSQPLAHIVILSGETLSQGELNLVQATFTKARTSTDALLSSLEACLGRDQDNSQ